MITVIGMEMPAIKDLHPEAMRVHDTWLTIADLKFQLRTGYPVAVSKEFSPFLTEAECGTGSPKTVPVSFLPVKQLQREQTDLIWREGAFSVYGDGDGFARYYFSPGKDSVPYARSIFKPQTGMEVSYLQEREGELLSCRNCFLHMAFEELLLGYGRLILHASCVDTSAGGILFSGPCGVGKSTQAELWRRLEGASIVNGDRAIIYRKENGWLASGSPYAGSSGYYVNRQVPVTAVIILEQAAYNAVCRLNPGEAFRRLYPGLVINSWNPDYVEQACDICQEFVESIPVYRLACTPDGEAVKAVKKVLQKGGNLHGTAY